MMHRNRNSSAQLNHFTPFLSAGAWQDVPDMRMRMPVRRQRRIEFALLAIIITSLGAFVAGML